MKNILVYKLGIFVILFGCNIPFLIGSNPVQPPKAVCELELIKTLTSTSLNNSNNLLTFLLELPTVESTDINNAIKRGSASDLAQFLNSTIELVLPGNEGTFSSAQAQMILASFFSKHPAKSFVVKQEGSSSSTSNFVIGTYTSSANKDFRVYYVTKKIGTKELIQHIEFELK